MNVSSNDGNANNVRLYSDISAGKWHLNRFIIRQVWLNSSYLSEWVSGNLNTVVDWSVTNEDGVIMIQTQRQTIAGFSEINDHAEDSTAYYSTLNVS